jgi:hypothetical protein
MADYPAVTTLATLDETIPTGSEDLAKMDDALRQTRGFLKTFLAVAHTDTGALKAGSVPVGGVAAGSIRGSTGIGGTQREILQGTIQDVDLAPGSVTQTKIGPAAVKEIAIDTGAVTYTKLGTNSVITAKVLDRNITGAKIALGSNGVLKENMANNSVGSDQLEANAVTDAKVGTGIITPGKLKSATANTLMVGDATKFIEYEVDATGAMTFAIVGGKIKFAVAGSSAAQVAAYVLIEEKSAKGTDAGGSAATTWNQRATGGGYTLTQNALGLVSLPATPGNVKIVTAGTYLVQVASPVYGAVGQHKVALVKKNGASWDLLAMGTNGEGLANAVTYSFVRAVVTFAVNDEFALLHYTQSAVAVNGLGKATNINDPAGAGALEYYARIELLRG